MPSQWALHELSYTSARAHFVVARVSASRLFLGSGLLPYDAPGEPELSATRTIDQAAPANAFPSVFMCTGKNSETRD